MVALDSAAPILLFVGLTTAPASSVSLLNNLEIAATSLIAMAYFKEAVGARLWLAIALITLSGVILSIGDWDTLALTPGALCVIAATVIWGLENNCTRALSLSDPIQIVAIKGVGSGSVTLILALCFETIRFDVPLAALSLAFGFVTAGLSVWFYIRSQRETGAARTSSICAIAPFIGVALSFIVLSERPAPSFYLALPLMLLGVYLSASERHSHYHSHKKIVHEHSHTHDDGHHAHAHPEGNPGRHTHLHEHSEISHSHEHLPDMHHSHGHKEEKP
jgi:drug/metabolite transporter (DMT)-like permease